MAVTRLKRKVKKNRTRAKQRKATMKRLLNTPVIKHVDMEQLKKELSVTEKSETPTPA
jgi:hypothetical protein